MAKDQIFIFSGLLDHIFKLINKTLRVIRFAPFHMKKD
jgi:hypothetical protein